LLPDPYAGNEQDKQHNLGYPIAPALIRHV